VQARLEALAAATLEELAPADELEAGTIAARLQASLVAAQARHPLRRSASGDALTAAALTGAQATGGQTCGGRPDAATHNHAGQEALRTMLVAQRAAVDALEARIAVLQKARPLEATLTAALGRFRGGRRLAAFAWRCFARALGVSHDRAPQCAVGRLTRGGCRRRGCRAWT